jgi:hypothetical protein
VRTLQRIRRCRSCDPELVDDKGDHLHRDRLIQEGWLASVYDPAPAPLWRDPRAIQRLITLDHLLRMRSGETVFTRMP